MSPYGIFCGGACKFSLRHPPKKTPTTPIKQEAVVGGLVKANIDVLDGVPVQSYLLCEVIGA